MNVKERLKKLYEELAMGDALYEREMAKRRYANYVAYVHRYDKKFKLARFPGIYMRLYR